LARRATGKETLDPPRVASEVVRPQAAGNDDQIGLGHRPRDEDLRPFDGRPKRYTTLTTPAVMGDHRQIPVLRRNGLDARGMSPGRHDQSDTLARNDLEEGLEHRSPRLIPSRVTHDDGDSPSRPG
jgi:hypothetical protein